MVYLLRVLVDIIIGTGIMKTRAPFIKGKQRGYYGDTMLELFKFLYYFKQAERSCLRMSSYKAFESC